MIDSIIPAKKTDEQSRDDLINCLDIIETNIQLYDLGKLNSYKTISANLRQLLCDPKRRKDNSLLPRVFLDPYLHPVTFTPDLNKMKERGETLLFFMPGTISTGSNLITNYFDTSKTSIPLQEWLDQLILDDSITIRKLIRSVADKDGGAHTDENYDETLLKTKSTKINHDSANSILLVTISRYIVEEVKKWL